MYQSEHLDQLAAALAAAQGAIENPPRNKDVTVKSDKGSYTFSYATLDGIRDLIRRPLADNGLSVLQMLRNGDGKYRLVTRILHASGQWIESEMPILVESAKPQAFGSALTYARRYSLCAMLAIVADEDDDANAAEGNHIESKRERPAAQRQDAPQPIKIKPPKSRPGPIEVPPELRDRPEETWKAWSLAFKDWLLRAMTVDEVDGWVRKNDGQLRNLKDFSGTAYAHLMEVAVLRKQQIAEAADPNPIAAE